MATTDSPPSPAQNQLWRPALGLVIDYLRWTQLVPMAMAWAFMLLMVAALLVTNFQQQSFSLIEWGVTGYERLFGPIEQESQQAASQTVATPAGPQDGSEDESDEDGGIRFSEADVEPWVMKIWGLLALGGWVLGLLRAWLFGPRSPMSLKRKLAWAALAAAAASALCFAAWLFGSETFHGSAIAWAALFIGAPALVWCISAWGLSVSHLLDFVRARIERGPPGRESESAETGTSQP